MKIIKCANCVIEIDIEKTKEYYRNFEREDTQGNRNFEKYCEKLSEDEKEFFETFGIDPLGCNIEHFGVSRKKTLPCGGDYLVCGRYLQYPKIGWITVEELVENNFEDTYEEKIDVTVGNFWFQFLNKDEFEPVPEEMPEGFIKINFWCEELPWVLKEKCEEKLLEEPRKWEIHKIIIMNLKFKLQMKRNLKEEIKTVASEFEKFFSENSIKAERLTKKQTAAFKKSWVDKFSPVGADKKDIIDKCIKGRFKEGIKIRKYTPFLWHLFSFEYVKPEEERAKELYNEQTKDAVFLFSSYENLAYKLENVKNFDAKFLECFTDVVITAKDFSWTYAKTHEEYDGPYFYKK